MTVEEKRKILDEFCDEQISCYDGCCLEGDVCRCGFGQTFLTKNTDGSYKMTDEEIENAYAVAFGEEIDSVNHPAHYQGKHECIDEMIALFGVEAVKAFCRCNVYKYKYRADKKNGQEDLDKADWYMDKLMELEKGEKECTSN